MKESVAMVTTAGRDPTKEVGVMQHLFGLCTSRNLLPLAWEIGFFVHVDMIRMSGRRCAFGEPWRPMDTIFGCKVTTAGLDDVIRLVCSDRGTIVRLQTKDY